MRRGPPGGSFPRVRAELPPLRSPPWFVTPLRVPQRRPQQELDLAVQAAQVVVRPALNGIQHVAIDPKQKGFPVGHECY